MEHGRKMKPLVSRRDGYRRTINQRQCCSNSTLKHNLIDNKYMLLVSIKRKNKRRSQSKKRPNCQ
ncbi:Uncharacterized protein APZ42_019685 [Daphnia magna]|uniref:Uncharacterized protein n=1 Tax=Daphnia magna TaxID=35525 RepID=A0A164YC95_9CRUS|nr:Uncharacterized protein APZ42_019685 [Daphnia magna]